MKVVMLKDEIVYYGPMRCMAGQEYELPTELAKSLIGRGLAQELLPAEPPAEPEPEPEPAPKPAKKSPAPTSGLPLAKGGK